MLSIVRTNSATSIRLGDDLWYISVWAAPPNRVTFWDGAPSLISPSFEQESQPLSGLSIVTVEEEAS